LNDTRNVEIGSNHRNVQLDFLRGVAILMVVVHHTVLFRVPSGWQLPLIRCGWAGVDLFFVLSGFLISGLLFSEYRRKGKIDFWRFAARRALKIYPAFYVLVLLTIVIRIVSDRHDLVPVLQAFLHDVFFIQSYLPGTYGHFWSLSIEEHFYILLPLTLYFMLRRSKPNQDDPFLFLPWLFAIVAITELIARLLTARWIPFTFLTHLMATHLRIDSLLFGVLLSYWANFHGERFWRLVLAKYPFILASGVLLISPTLVLPNDNHWMYTYGFTALYLGFGAIMLSLLALPVASLSKSAQAFFGAIAYIGGFSYSIYLWHVPWVIVLQKYSVVHIRYLGVFIYITGAIVIGIIAAKLVEMPVLRLRERLFPTHRQGAAARLTAASVKPAQSYRVVTTCSKSTATRSDS
jgi:peptidoglycan/LPS O-acetylase OafA/YrhL